ncbi:MAG: anti-sigma factor [Actinomycetota bacterium]
MADAQPGSGGAAEPAASAAAAAASAASALASLLDARAAVDAAAAEVGREGGGGDDPLASPLAALQAAEDELREAEERLRLATDAGHIGIWEWDLARDKVVWSERVYQLWLLRDGEAVPAGLLDVDDRGQGAHVMTGDMSDVSAVALTIEPAGGSPQPTTEPITVMQLPSA